MMISKYHDLTPVEFIKKLFEDTTDGILKITYYPFLEDTCYEVPYPVKWDKADCEEVISEYEQLEKALIFLGEHYDELTAPEGRAKLLDDELLAYWKIYGELFKKFRVSDEEIEELNFRGEYDQLTDEEYALLEEHYQWYEEQMLERLPFKGKSPHELIGKAQKYILYVKLKAAEPVLKAHGKEIAEELVLYNYKDTTVKLENELDKILSGEAEWN